MKRFKLESPLRMLFTVLGRLSLAAAHILAAVVIGWLVLRWYPGDRWMPVRLGSYFAPWLLMALLPAFAIAMAGHRRNVSVLIAALVFIMAMQYWPVLVPRHASAFADTDSDRLRVMTFNVNFKNHNVAGIAELIAAEQPDIIAFQEMTEEFAVALHEKIEETHPHLLVDNSWALKMVIMSRYPLEAQPKPPDAVRAQHALINTSSGPVLVWNVHPNPAVSSGWEPQRALLARVADDVSQQERRVIVLGDFNTTDQSENYRLIANHLSDAHWAVGRGFGFTFPNLSRAIQPDQPWYIQTMLKVRPLVKIDHILVSQHFTPRRSYVVPQSYGSDHLPVVAELTVKSVSQNLGE